MRSVVLLLTLVGCYAPSYGDCEVSCAASTCPAGLACSAGVCRTAGATGACGSLGNDAHPDDSLTDGVNPDGLTGGSPWSSPTMVTVPPVVGATMDDPTFDGTLLDIYFNAGGRFYTSHRTALGQPFGTLTLLQLATVGTADGIDVSPDGLTVIFGDTRVAANGIDLEVATRTDVTMGWLNPVPQNVLNSSSADVAPCLSADQKTVVFESNRSSVTLNDIYISERALATDPWPTPQQIPTLSTSNSEQSPHLSADKLTIYFQRSVNNTGDLFYATRPTLTGAWGSPIAITELNTTGDESDPWVSPDGHHIFFMRTVGGTVALWEATR